MVKSTLALARADLSSIAIVGGHFSWNIWEELPSYQIAHGDKNIAMGNGGESRVADSCAIGNTDHHSGQSDQSVQSNQNCVPSETAVNPGLNSTPSMSPDPGPISNPSPNPGSSPGPDPSSNPGPGLPAVPPCFVAARHPVARAISYYYQRCYDTYGCSGYQRYMNDLSVEELQILVKNYRHVGAGDPMTDEFAMVLNPTLLYPTLQYINPTLH